MSNESINTFIDAMGLAVDGAQVAKHKVNLVGWSKG